MKFKNRERVKALLKPTGLHAGPVVALRGWNLRTAPRFAAWKWLLGNYVMWRRQHGSVLRTSLVKPSGTLRKALIVGKGTLVGAKIRELSGVESPQITFPEDKAIEEIHDFSVKDVLSLVQQRMGLAHMWAEFIAGLKWVLIRIDMSISG